MSNATTDGSHRITPARILVAMAFGLFVACAVFVYRTYSQYAVEQRWMNDIEQLGARAHSAGYEDTSSGIGRVPILGEIVTHRSQVELFLDNPATVDAVLSRATELPRLGRIWVDLTVFDRSMGDRIEQKLPGMDVIFYTPGPSMSQDARRRRAATLDRAN